MNCNYITFSFLLRGLSCKRWHVCRLNGISMSVKNMYICIFLLCYFYLHIHIFDKIYFTYFVDCYPALQKEQEILEAIETLGPSANLKTLQPLESILAGMKFVSTAPPSVTADSTNLTDVAVNVIGRLPDLSFMHASVLMFPVKGDQ